MFYFSKFQACLFLKNPDIEILTYNKYFLASMLMWPQYLSSHIFLGKQMTIQKISLKEWKPKNSLKMYQTIRAKGIANSQTNKILRCSIFYYFIVKCLYAKHNWVIICLFQAHHDAINWQNLKNGHSQI